MPKGFNLSRLFLFICLGSSLSFAGFFLDSEIEKPPVKQNSFFSYGGGVFAAYYLSAFDFGVNLQGQFRLLPHHGLNLFFNADISEPFYEAGGDWHFIFWGTLPENGFENYFRLGFSGTLFEKSEKWHSSPLIFAGCGRDTRLWENAQFLIRVGFRISYLLGESIGRGFSVYGIKQTKIANTVIHGEFSILLF